VRDRPEKTSGATKGQIVKSHWTSSLVPLPVVP
jgi:hypothetical protein